MLYNLILVLIILVSVLLILIVLVQNSKGGGLVSNFSSQNQMMGVRRTNDFLEKATWTLASALLALSVFASITIPRASEEEGSRIQEQIENAIDPYTVPNTYDFDQAAEEQNQQALPKEEEAE